MLTAILEHLLINTVNRIRHGRARDRSHDKTAKPESTDEVILGKSYSITDESEDGFITNDGETVSLTPLQRMRHVYGIGGSGSGKTNFLMGLLAKDIESGHSIAVFDLRGDLIDRLLIHLAHQSDPKELRGRLLLIDLRDHEYVVPCNPLAGAGDPYGRATFVLGAIRKQSDSWGVQIEETARAVLIALASKNFSLMDIEPLLADPGFRQQVLADNNDWLVRSFFKRYESLKPEEQATWQRPVMNKLAPFLGLPQLRRMFCTRSSVPLRQIIDRPGSIMLVALAVDQLHEAAHLAGSVLVNMLQNAIMTRVDVPETHRNPIFWYVDEFQNLASDRFEEVMAEGRRFGVGVHLTHQTLSQLDTTLRSLVRTNAATQLFFGTGYVDAAELARDVVCDLTNRDVARMITTLAAGNALLVRRGQEAVRLKVPHTPDPKVRPEAIEAVKAVARENFARPASEIDAELLACEQSTSSESEPEEYEIRKHVRGRRKKEEKTQDEP